MQGEWPATAGRRDPIAVLKGADAHRIPALAALKVFRMAASPFGFFRGAAAVMAADLATQPVTGLRTQICGDAHVRNLGAYAAPDGETIVGPWEWDLKRLATSLVLAGRESRSRPRSLERAVRSLVRSYRETLDRLSRVFVLASLAEYRDTLGPDRQLAFDAYRPVDVAFKVVGTGSVGTRDFVVLMLGRGPADPLLLQVKEALPSCYARWLLDVPPCRHQGRRVAEGQHRMQSATDPLLGWTRIDGRDYIVRQLADHKAGLDPDDLRGEALASYALVSGEILAKAHARTGDAAAIFGYCGRSDRLDRALARFAFAYADQTERDHARLLAAIKARQIHAASEFRLHRGWRTRHSRAASGP